MKIFNWMHRKLQPNISYCQISQKKEVFGGETEKKGEMVHQKEGERDTEALLLHDMLDGILTIGTLGHGHPCHPLFSQSYSTNQEESLQKELEKKEEKQQVVAVAAFVVQEYKPMTVVESSIVIKSAQDEEGKQMVQMVAMEEEEKAEKLLEEEPLLKDAEEKRERGRTTLAELLAADAASIREKNASKKSQVSYPATGPQPACRKTSRQQVKKKGANSPLANTTTTKLHRLITRMLKKKIHPEVNEPSTGEESPMTGPGNTSSHPEVA